MIGRWPAGRRPRCPGGRGGRIRGRRDVRRHRAAVRRQGCGGDRGSMTVVMLGVIAGALVLAVLVGGLVRGVTARGQAQAAADLAALAAAEVAAVGGTAPCETADRVAGRNRAVLAGCQVGDGGMVDLVTEVAVQLLPGWQQRASATARAGPVGRS